MKKSKLLLILFGIIVSIISVSSTLFLNKKNIDTIFVVEEDTYGYEYAKNNNIEILYDSNKDNYVAHIEEFVYNEIDGGLEIIEYKGISKELIIPKSIKGKKVISINTNFDSVERLVISKNIKSLEVDLKDIVLVCYANELCNNSELKTEIIPDSEANNYYFGEYNIDFAYNIKDNEIEIKEYLGTNEFVLIPETINGYEVTKLSLNIDLIDKIYIPKTVNDIDFNTSSNEFSLFIIISILTLIVYVGIILLTSYKKNSINNAPIYIVSLVYLIGLTIYTYFNFNNKLLIVVYVATTLIYLFVSLALIFTKKKSESYDEKIKNTGSFIKDCLYIINELKDNKELENLNKLEDTIKYSDPVSNDATLEVEKEILNDLKNIKTTEDIESINKKILKRNMICKDNK